MCTRHSCSTQEDLLWLEKSLICWTRSLEEHGGYNKSLGKERGLAARIRDTESKLRRKGKYVPLNSLVGYTRIAVPLATTFCQGERPLRLDAERRESECLGDANELGQYVDAFQLVDLRALTRQRITKMH